MMVASSLQHDAATVAGAARACTTIVDYDELLKRVSDTKFVLIGEAIEKKIAQRFNAGISITLSRSSPDRGDRRVLSSPTGLVRLANPFPSVKTLGYCPCENDSALNNDC
jgi:hypothetical protein